MTIGSLTQFKLPALTRVLLALALALFPVFRAPAANSVRSPLGSPTAPLEEEEEKRGEARLAAMSAQAERKAGSVKVRLAVPDQTARPFATGSPVLPRSAPLDHFRNGLGSPFRC